MDSLEGYVCCMNNCTCDEFKDSVSIIICYPNKLYSIAKHIRVLIFNRRYRYTAYRQLVRWCCGYLGRHRGLVLPSCVLKKIRDAFPADDRQYSQEFLTCINCNTDYSIYNKLYWILLQVCILYFQVYNTKCIFCITKCVFFATSWSWINPLTCIFLWLFTGIKLINKITYMQPTPLLSIKLVCIWLCAYYVHRYIKGRYIHVYSEKWIYAMKVTSHMK